MEPLASDSDVPRPIFLRADRMDGETDRQMNAYGDAELRKTGTVANAERMTYWPIDDEIEAEGNVRLQQPDSLITGPKLRLKLEDQIGYFEQPSYAFRRPPDKAGKPETEQALAARLAGLGGAAGADGEWASGFATPWTMGEGAGQVFSQSTAMPTATEGRGTADRIDFEGENQYRAANATYTTCAPGNDDWYARAGDLKLDYDHEEGEARNATVYFKDVPILYSPWLPFPLSDQRMSGLLPPKFGASSDNGFEYSQPYYWNIAPNMDATIAPRLMTKRGVQLSNELRYLNTMFGALYQGNVEAEVLPNDRLRDGDHRYGLSLLHTQAATPSGLSGTVNYNKVSDDNYYTDLSSNIARSSQTQLLQQGTLTYAGAGWWSSTLKLQQYQTLQPDDEETVREQYRMLPQFTLNARKPDFYLADVGFLGQYTNFTIRERLQDGKLYPDGKRSVLYPQVALPYVTPGWYVTPKAGVNYRHYALTNQAAGTPDSISTTLPIYSVDSGMTFERPSNWFGRDFTQTLEPRLYYLYVPYRKQADIPNFDTAWADFNFAQIFSENQFSGWDKISNANHLTAALTSRLIEPATGNEIMRAMVGQRFYFDHNRVSLDEAATVDRNRSDFLAVFSGRILPAVFADTAVQYNADDQQVERYSLGLRYQPQPGKVLNAAYRYNRGTQSTDNLVDVNQVDFSGQWPLFGRWHGVGRLNYSFKDERSVAASDSQGGRIIEAIAGLEYDAGCWVLRTVMQRQARTSNDASTSFFIQLELSGFARIGTSPLNLLKRSVQGYGLINQAGTESAFDE